MKLKNVVKKILESESLKSKLKGISSFEGVYRFFKDNGYEGTAQELKERLFGNVVPFRILEDNDLLNIAGGVSGRQVLSACVGFMMLMGATSIINPHIYATDTRLQSAVKDNNFDEIKKLCEENVDLINEKDELGLTPLHHAVRNKDMDTVKYLVEHGADVNGNWHVGITPLSLAHSLEETKYLVEHGATISGTEYLFYDLSTMEKKIMM